MVNKEASETQVERSGQKNEEVKKRSKEEKAHNMRTSDLSQTTACCGGVDVETSEET